MTVLEAVNLALLNVKETAIAFWRKDRKADFSSQPLRYCGHGAEWKEEQVSCQPHRGLVSVVAQSKRCLREEHAQDHILLSFGAVWENLYSKRAYSFRSQKKAVGNMYFKC